jgi:plastocyanin
MQGVGYQPAKLSVRPGDTVVWVNKDIVPHTATFDAKGPAAWDSGILAADSTAAFVARSPGTVAYHCRFHPTMKGTIVIGAAQ